jgi:hypothetical protein
MKRLTSFALGGVLALALGANAACGNRAQLKTCKFVEIEGGEVEVKFGNVDAERGEQVACVRDERSRNSEVFCHRPGAASEFVSLTFSYDD